MRSAMVLWLLLIAGLAGCLADDDSSGDGDQMGDSDRGGGGGESERDEDGNGGTTGPREVRLGLTNEVLDEDEEFNDEAVCGNQPIYDILFDAGTDGSTDMAYFSNQMSYGCDGYFRGSIPDDITLTGARIHYWIGCDFFAPGGGPGQAEDSASIEVRTSIGAEEFVHTISAGSVCAPTTPFQVEETLALQATDLAADTAVSVYVYTLMVSAGDNMHMRVHGDYQPSAITLEGVEFL